MIYITLYYLKIFYINLKCCFSTFEDLVKHNKIIKLSPNYTNEIYKHLQDKISKNVNIYCIVKNPFHRFVSFYKDKFIECFKNKNATITIFDRFGKLLSKFESKSQGWDGRWNGALMPSSDYWFVVEYYENSVKKQFKSHFSLKR